jgi:hypothetical protein
VAKQNNPCLPATRAATHEAQAIHLDQIVLQTPLR